MHNPNRAPFVRPRNLLLALFVFTLPGCTSAPIQAPAEGASTASAAVVSGADAAGCIGSTELPPEYRDRFAPIEDSALLAEAIGAPDKGGVCQGAVYQATGAVTLYRAWNSTNPYSRLGKWWALDEPAGKVARYRSDYEICYQFSPLDKLTRCTLRAGSKVVVGTGQSVYCSDYLTYPVSPAQQVYLDDATPAVLDCEDFDGIFTWQPATALGN